MPSRIDSIKAEIKGVIEELSGYPPEDLPDNSTFLELGFDSLFLTQLATAFQNQFGIEVTFRQLFDELPSIAALSAKLDADLPSDRFAEEASGAEGADGERAAEPPTRASPIAAADFSEWAGQLRSVSGSSIQEVIAQQLDLMQRQLAMLTGQAPAGAGAGTPAARPPVVAVASEADAVDAGIGGEEAASAGDAMPAGFGPSPRSADARGMTPMQRAHVDTLVERYTRRTKTSKALTQRYRGWHADPRTAAGFNPLWKEMVYPIWVERSSGARLWDVDGNEYIDILNGFGPNFLGHSPPFVTEALKAQLERGIEVGPQTPLAGEAAQLLCEMTGMDRVSWVNTGSEAVQAAIRLSRTVTGRETIVVFRKDYHGNFDEVLVRGVTVRSEPRSVPLAPGIPRRAVQDVVALEYGSDEALEWMRHNGDRVAAVLVEPVQSRKPELQPREFLHELRRITHETGTVLVFDEVITGFRTGPGGAQALFGVEADLATYGKVVGGGMPIGVVAGRSRFMDTFDGGMWQYGDDSFPSAGVTFFAGTFVRHPMAMAAAKAVLEYLGSQTPAFWDAVNGRTTRFASGANEIFRSRGIDIEVPHCCSQMFIRVNEPNELATLLFYHLRDRGVHVLEGFPSYMTVAHTDEDVDALLEKLESSVDEMVEVDLFDDGSAGSAAAVDEGVLAPVELPLTVGQRDVWLASQVSDAASCAFNESDTIELLGELDVEIFLEAVEDVLRRHQAFGLTFAPDGSRQRWSEPEGPRIDFLDFSDRQSEERREAVAATLREQALRPFDLEAGPIVRTLLIRLNPQHHLFVLYAHHVVFDGWSADVVMADLAEVYSARKEARAEELEAATAFAAYQAAESSFQEASGADARAYWAEALAGLPGHLDLPADRPRGTARSFAGDTVHATLDSEVSEAVHEAARAMGVTVHALLLTAFQVLLSRLSGQTDFVVGVPAAGQAWSGLPGVVGYCVNLVPVRCRCEGVRFADLARANRKAVLDAFDHQLADLGPVVRDLGIAREAGRLPLVEVVFNYSSYLTTLGFSGLEARAYENRRAAVFHDLFLNVVESPDGLVVDWDYNTDLFDEETIRQWIGHLEVILGAVSARPTVAVQEVPLIGREEQARLADGSA